MRPSATPTGRCEHRSTGRSPNGPFASNGCGTQHIQRSSVPSLAGPVGRRPCRQPNASLARTRDQLGGYSQAVCRNASGVLRRGGRAEVGTRVLTGGTAYRSRTRAADHVRLAYDEWPAGCTWVLEYSRRGGRFTLCAGVAIHLFVCAAHRRRSTLRYVTLRECLKEIIGPQRGFRDCGLSTPEYPVSTP